MKSRFSIAVFAALAACGIAAGSAGPAWAQGFPSKPIRLVVPYPAGGATDTAARTVAQKLTEALAQQVVVDNRAGAGGNIAADLVAKAPADGYTLFFGVPSTLVINPHMFSKLSFDPQKDFVPVGMVTVMPLFVAVPATLPVTSLKELVALAKAKPGALSYGSSGVGGTSHLAVELFKSVAGVDIVHVPYKGTAAAVADILTGNIQLIFDAYATSAPQVKAGKMRFLAVGTAKRSSLEPALPTVAESGYPGFDASFWCVIVAPTGTPKDVVAKLNTELNKVMASPDVRERLAGLAMEPLSGTPEQAAAFIRSEDAKWAKVVKDSGAKAD